MKKTWAEKLCDKDHFPKVLVLERRFPCYHALHKMGVPPGSRIVLAQPSEVVALMKAVPEGRLTTIVEICDTLGKKHGVDGCCTLTTGIFIMVAANAEADCHGKLGIPYWRTLKSGGQLNDKYPGGVESHKRLLEREGFSVVRKGKAYLVENYRDYLVSRRRTTQDSVTVRFIADHTRDQKNRGRRQGATNIGMADGI